MANRYAKTLGGNWSTASTWSMSASTGTDNAAVPTASDDVFFDAGSTGTVTVNTTTCVAKTVTCSNAGNTIVIDTSQKLAVSGNITLVSGMSLTGSGNLTMHAAGTLASAGITIPGSLTFDAGVTYVLNGNVVVTGLVTFSGSGCILNWTTNETLTCNGGATASAAVTSGTAKLIIGGGTLQSTTTTTYFTNNIDLAGNITIGTNLAFRTKTLTYVSGTITTASSTLTLGTATLNTPSANMSWDNISSIANPTWTLTNAITCTGTASVTGSIINTSNITCAGLNAGAGGSTTTGINITITGGIWQGAGTILNATIIFAGDITVSGSVKVSGTSSITYSSGTITTTGSTLTIGTGTGNVITLNTIGSSMHWNNITTSNITLNLTNDIILDGTFLFGVVTLNTSNITCAGLSSTTGAISGVGRTITVTGGTIAIGTGTITANVVFLGGVNTITISGTLSVAGIITYTSGVMSVGTSNLTLIGNSTLNTSGMSWYDIQVRTITLTLSSALICTNTLDWTGYSPTMAGNFNITCGTFKGGAQTATSSFTLLAGTTMTATNLNLIGNYTGAYTTTLKSSTTSSAFLIYNGTMADCKNLTMLFTWIDASGGNPVYSFFGGTLSNTVNITTATGGIILATDIFGMIG